MGTVMRDVPPVSTLMNAVKAKTAMRMINPCVVTFVIRAAGGLVSPESQARLDILKQKREERQSLQFDDPGR
jgi:hypothetical protein